MPIIHHKQKQVSQSVTSANEEANKKQSMQFKMTTMLSVQLSEFALQSLTNTKPSQKPGEAPEHNRKINQLSFVRTIQQFEKHNQFPEQIKKQVETLVSLDKKRRQTAQER